MSETTVVARFESTNYAVRVTRIESLGTSYAVETRVRWASGRFVRKCTYFTLDLAMRDAGTLFHQYVLGDERDGMLEGLK